MFMNSMLLGGETECEEARGHISPTANFTSLAVAPAACDSSIGC